MIQKEIFNLFFILIILINYIQSYEIPKPTIKVYQPRGLNISIPDVPGLNFVAFHLKLNRAINPSEIGDFQGEIREPTNGVWLYSNPGAVIKINDVLHYWMFVQHERLGYVLEDQSKKIIAYENSTPTRKPAGTTTPTTRRPGVTSAPTRHTTPAACLSTITTVRGKTNICKGQLIFEDNFDTAIDSTKWQKEIRLPAETEDAEFVVYNNYPENCYIKDNKLVMAPKLLTDFPGFTEDRLRGGDLTLDSCTGNTGQECYRRATGQFILPPIVSCKLTTQNSFAFKYGKVEIRAKLPKGDWLFPQLFLNPALYVYGQSSYSSGQMRVAFIRGNDRLSTIDNTAIDGSSLSGGLVLSPQSNLRKLWMKSILLNRHLGDEFHNYTLVWTDELISVAVDGTNYGNYRSNFRNEAQLNNITKATKWMETDSLAPFDKEFVLTLGIGVGGLSDFPDKSRTGATQQLKPWNNTSPKSEFTFWSSKNSWYPTWINASMQIDYVKVWAL